MDPSTLIRAAEQLKRTTDEHATWHENLLRSIFCDLPCRDEDLAPSAHRECSFGHWYYDEAPNRLREQPAFIATGKEHHRLHQVAAKLLRAARTDAPVARTDFEELVAISARLRMQVGYLQASIDAALANRDALTGALGRIGLLPELHELRALARKTGAESTVAFMDVDNLKQLNDTHGHPAGDAVLAGAVQYLYGHLRANDKVFRYGGDEFVIVLPQADLEVAQGIIGRLRDGLATQLLITNANGPALTVSASFGLALIDPDAAVIESVGRADQALLLAKSTGKGRIVRWDANITTSTRWRRIEVKHPTE
jgi:diguanylate cyclase (GGDEF)-like protein